MFCVHLLILSSFGGFAYQLPVPSFVYSNSELPTFEEDTTAYPTQAIVLNTPQLSLDELKNVFSQILAENIRHFKNENSSPPVSNTESPTNGVPPENYERPPVPPGVDHNRKPAHSELNPSAKQDLFTVEEYTGHVPAHSTPTQSFLLSAGGAGLITACVALGMFIFQRCSPEVIPFLTKQKEFTQFTACQFAGSPSLLTATGHSSTFMKKAQYSKY